MIVLYTDAACLNGHDWLVGVYDPDRDSIDCGMLSTSHSIVAEAHAAYAAAIHLNTQHITQALVLTDCRPTVRYVGGIDIKWRAEQDVYQSDMPEIREALQKLGDAWQEGWTLAWVPSKRNLAHKPLERARAMVT